VNCANFFDLILIIAQRKSIANEFKLNKHS